MKIVRAGKKETASMQGFLFLLGGLCMIQLLLPDPLKVRCLFRLWSGHPCPTCGATRCAELLLHGNWPAAFITQPLVFAALLGLALLQLYLLAARLLQKPVLVLQLETRRGKILALLLAIALIACNWVYLLMK